MSGTGPTTADSATTASPEGGRPEAQGQASHSTISAETPSGLAGLSDSSKLMGIGVGRGIAMAKVLRMPDPLPEPGQAASSRGADEEKKRVAEALQSVGAQIQERGERAGGAAQHVLEAQVLMTEDPTLHDNVDALIDGGSTAERAVFEAFADFRDILLGMGGYMSERATDLDDLSQRAIAVLSGVAAPGVPESDEPFILIARDLAPADTAVLDLNVVKAIVTSDGGPTSHTAILAREKSIVAVVGVGGALEIGDGRFAIVDAREGSVTVSPSDSEKDAAQTAITELANRTVLTSGPGALADGTSIPLLANLGSADGASSAVELGAEGVGLFRTEFLFLDASSAPSIEEQKKHYSALFAAFPSQKVVVRALDAGADKPLSFLNDDQEANPALGLRGLRALRASPAILDEQLRAIAEAAAESTADVWVMAPMVATVEEASYFTELAHGLGIEKVGVMIEVPSAAVLADRILAVTDFVSVGTNDLTQYTMAADRLLGSVSSFQDPWHPAVLSLIKMIGDAGISLDKAVGVCGEAAADPMLAVVLVGLGATTLSMSPSALAEVRTELARFSIEEARDLADVALATGSAAEARSAVLAASEKAE